MPTERRHLPSRIADLRGLGPSLRELSERGRAAPLLYLEITGLDTMRGTQRRAALQVCKQAVATALAASAGSVLRRGDIVAAGPEAAWFAALLVGRAVDARAQAVVADPDLAIAAMRLRSSVLEAFRKMRPGGAIPRRAGVRVGWTVVDPVDPAAPIAGLRHAVRGAAVLARVEERRSTFLASVTHELRTPLTAIVGYIERLQSEPGLAKKKQRHYLDVIASEAARLTRLVEGLIDAGAWGAGSLRLNVAPVDIGGIVERAWHTVEPRYAERRIRFIQHGGAVAPLDGERMLQVLVNLIDNAARHARTEIEVRIGVRAGELRIAVNDDGEGFSRETLRDFAQPFALGPGGRFGLGLSITRLLVEAHGAKLRAATRRNGGTSVTIKLHIAS
ncbi:MAG TPA: ATP-binding protein [Candidatus Eremiobacteraceae bacterium]